MPGAIWDESLVENLGTRPELYVNFSSDPPPKPPATAQGTVYIVGGSDWGPTNTAVDLFTRRDVEMFLGTAESPRRAAVLEAFKQGATRVIYRRIADNTAAKAAVTLKDSVPEDVLTVTAKHSGTFGNTIRVEVVSNLNGTDKDLNIYVGPRRVDTFTGANNTALVAAFAAQGSEYVDVALSGAGNRVPANVAPTALTGGLSGSSVVAQDYLTALDASIGVRFRALVIETDDYTIQAAVSAWVREQRDSGNKVVAIFGAASDDTKSEINTQAGALNYEGVHLVGNGGITAEGVTLTPLYASWAVAGLAVARGTSSITNQHLVGWQDAAYKYAQSEYGPALTSGVIIISADRGPVKIEQGLNTLQPASQVAPKSRDWRKMRYVAIQDEMVDRINVQMADQYLGNVPNDDRGRREAVRQVQSILDGMVRDALLEGLNPANADEQPGPESFLDPRFPSTQDRVFVGITGKVVDSIEYFYITVAI